MVALGIADVVVPHVLHAGLKRRARPRAIGAVHEDAAVAAIGAGGAAVGVAVQEVEVQVPLQRRLARILLLRLGKNQSQKRCV
ncbi:MAG: hypothetical protein TECD_01076 [Hyphomicrobiaceae bacterium hypho_1]